jgi:hypothetical protein
MRLVGWNLWEPIRMGDHLGKAWDRESRLKVKFKYDRQ